MKLHSFFRTWLALLLMLPALALAQGAPSDRDTVVIIGHAGLPRIDVRAGCANLNTLQSG